ncbi:MAG TPA: hypothetical protein VGK32_15715 [Vicinamibacterales bacterium]
MLIVVVVLLAVTAAQERALVAEARTGVFAQAALAQYVRDIVTQENYARFGFKSLADARSARVGTPLHVFEIDLRSLKAYRSGAGVKSMLRDAEVLWFPVTVAGAVITKVEIVGKDNRLIAGEFGGMRSAQATAAANSDFAVRLEERGIARAAGFAPALVRVPALGVTLLYAETSGGEFLLPAETNPERFGLNTGKVYAAAEVLSALATAAQQVDEKKIK